MRSTLEDAEVRRHLAGHGVEPTPSTPEELARFIRDEHLRQAASQLKEICGEDAADLARWDRQALERQEAIARPTETTV